MPPGSSEVYVPHRPREKGRGVEIKPSGAQIQGNANKCPSERGNPATAQGNSQWRQKKKSPVRASPRRRGSNVLVNYPQTKDLWALDVEKSSCIRHDNISHLSWVFTVDKRESPRLQSWDESASMFFLILDISDYGISRNASDRLAEIRTRP